VEPQAGGLQRRGGRALPERAAGRGRLRSYVPCVVTGANVHCRRFLSGPSRGA
jgi:hypothetical protein